MKTVLADMSTKKKTLTILAAVISILVTATVLFAITYKIQTGPVSKLEYDTDPVLFEVQEGQYMGDILAKLETEGIIKSAFFGKVNAKLGGFNQTYHGYFELDKTWTTQTILEYLSEEKNAAPLEVNITLVEGSWARDMAKKLSQHTTIPEDEFLELWNDKQYIARLMEFYEVLPVELLNNKDARVLLEGFLYPDTYTFRVDMSAKEITELIIANSNRQYQTVKSNIEKSGMSTYDLYTLASIVEYEASSEEDMKMVAGVFKNRLEQGIKLESSVTKCYALYDFDTWEDCERKNPESPYNTHLHQGLTPGPILNPSVKAIDATINAADHDYIFFIADVHGVKEKGKVFYQTTYAEHEKVRMELLGY